MLARRQELNTQLQVLIDAFLLALSLFSPRTTSVVALRSREIREYRPTPAPERQAGGLPACGRLVVATRCAIFETGQARSRLHRPLVARAGFQDSATNHPGRDHGSGGKIEPRRNV